MNITAGLIGKGLIALGAVGATGGVAVLASAGSKRTSKAEIAPKNPISVASGSVEMETKLVHKEPVYSDEEFSRKVEEIMEKVGLKGWCSKVPRIKKYVCDSKKSWDSLKKIRFASKNNSQEYAIKSGYHGVGMEILEFNDSTTFPGRIIFMMKNDKTLLSVVKKNASDKEGPATITVGVNGEFKFDDKKKALVWAWEDVNDLANKAGLECKKEGSGKSVKKTCKFIGGTKINIVDALDGKRKLVKGVTLDAEGVEWTYGDNFANKFQGYGFRPSRVVQVKYEDGTKEEDKTIKTIYQQYQQKDIYYRITRLATKVTEWYLTL